MENGLRLVLTGFMGVGKSSVARHLGNICGAKRLDLDHVIEDRQRRTIATIIDAEGEAAYRTIETDTLETVLLEGGAQILSLGGGTWMDARNRKLLAEHSYKSIWLEASFEHCWLNIAFSRKDRPLARDKARARALFDERQALYCLADWHFIVRPGSTSYDIAKQICEEIIG